MTGDYRQSERLLSPQVGGCVTGSLGRGDTQAVEAKTRGCQGEPDSKEAREPEAVIVSEVGMGRSTEEKGQISKGIETPPFPLRRGCLAPGRCLHCCYLTGPRSSSSFL